MEIFYAWECVSFLRKDLTSFDVVVKDMHQLLCLIHIVHRHVYAFDKPQNDQDGKQFDNELQLEFGRETFDKLTEPDSPFFY